MEIKPVLNHIKKNFDRILLAVMVLILLLFFAKYICVIREKAVPAEDKELCTLLGIPWRARSGVRDKDTFKEMLNKRANFVLGVKSAIFYRRLIYRNPFKSPTDLVVKPVTVTPQTLMIGIGERFLFTPLYGIGPYKWRCEPENLGTFEGDEFVAKTIGTGKIVVTDARGHEASTDKIEVVASKGTSVSIARDKSFIYKGSMTIIRPEGAETLGFIEEISTGKTYFAKSGEEIPGLAGFSVKEMTRDRLIIFDKTKGKDIELFREE